MDPKESLVSVSISNQYKTRQNYDGASSQDSAP